MFSRHKCSICVYYIIVNNSNWDEDMMGDLCLSVGIQMQTLLWPPSQNKIYIFCFLFFFPVLTLYLFTRLIFIFYSPSLWKCIKSTFKGFLHTSSYFLMSKTKSSTFHALVKIDQKEVVQVYLSSNWLFFLVSLRHQENIKSNQLTW